MKYDTYVLHLLTNIFICQATRAEQELGTHGFRVGRGRAARRRLERQAMTGACR